MHGLFFYIGLGFGLAAACGLRPFLPLLLAGALGSNHALGIGFSRGGFHFLQAGWWLLVVTVALALSYAAQIVLGLAPTAETSEGKTRSGPLAAALGGLGFGAGAVLFAGVLAAHGDSPWPGVVAGLLVVGVAQLVAGPVIAGARKRLPDKAAREALTIYLDAAALVLAALVALLHPLGYLALAALAWFLWRRRARADEKYAGLRILRR
jgi:MFS family permease